MTVPITKTRVRSISPREWPICACTSHILRVQPETHLSEAGWAGRQATARRSRQLERPQAFSYASYPGTVSQRGSKEGISSGHNAFTTSGNSREHRISGQLRPATATGSTITATGDDVTQIVPKFKPVDVLTTKDSIHLQQSPQSPDNAANTYSPLGSPPPNDDSVFLVQTACQDKRRYHNRVLRN